MIRCSLSVSLAAAWRSSNCCRALDTLSFRSVRVPTRGVDRRSYGGSTSIGVHCKISISLSHGRILIPRISIAQSPTYVCMYVCTHEGGHCSKHNVREAGGIHLNTKRVLRTRSADLRPNITEAERASEQRYPFCPMVLLLNSGNIPGIYASCSRGAFLYNKKISDGLDERRGCDWRRFLSVSLCGGACAPPRRDQCAPRRAKAHCICICTRDFGT